jgi:hypothetical protein
MRVFDYSKGRRRLRSQGQQQRAAEGASGAASCPCSVGGGGVVCVERRSHASLRCSLCGGVVCRACSRVVRPSARIRLCDTCYQHRYVLIIIILAPFIAYACVRELSRFACGL